MGHRAQATAAGRRGGGRTRVNGALAATQSLPKTNGGANLAWTLGFLGARAIPSLEQVLPTRYRRTIRVSGKPHLFDVALGPHRILGAHAWPLLPTRTLHHIAARLFDLGTDLRGFHQMARRDPILAGLVKRRPGLRMPGVLDPFECAVRAIVGQVVSVAAGRTLVGRIAARYGKTILNVDTEPLRVFPTPLQLAGVSPSDLTGLGITMAKARAIVGLAQSSIVRQFADTDLAAPGFDELETELIAIPGIGPWTAAYVRMRALGDADAFPATDHGVITALARLGVPCRRVGSVAERWRPWRAYATLQLWASLAD